MNLTTTSAEIPDASWESESRPQREKFSFWFQKLSDTVLSLTMVVPLDCSYADEAKARELFGGSGNTLNVRCKIESNMEAEKAAFTRLLNELYASEIGQVLRNAELTKISDSQLRSVLQPLVSHGQNVFFQLFVDDKIKYDKYAEEDKQVVRAAVLSAFSRPQVLYIDSDCPLFPWAFLHQDPDYKPSNYSTIKPEQFWGFMHEIQEEFPTTTQRLHLAANPEVVSAVDTTIDNCGLHDAEDHPFMKANITPASNIGDLRDKLANFGGHCLYFYGHANHDELPSRSTSWLELQHLRLTVAELAMSHAPKFKNNPVVAFLNGCNTSPLTRWDSNTVVGFLCYGGENRLCCVASVGELPATFAAEFAKRFWEKFLINRSPIGTALKSARSYMLERWNNPLGLLYSLFGRVDTFILPVMSASVTNANTTVSPT